jgi:hypothetical protein
MQVPTRARRSKCEIALARASRPNQTKPETRQQLQRSAFARLSSEEPFRRPDASPAMRTPCAEP